MAVSTIAQAFIYSNAQGQKRVDLETWSAFSVKYKITDKWSFLSQQQIRFDNNSSRFNQIFTELSAEKKIDKKWEYDFGLRLNAQYDYNGAITGFESYYRSHFSLTNIVPIGASTFENRIRYQRRNQIGRSKLEGDYIEEYLRLRTKWTYDFEKLKEDPFFYYEIFRRWQTGSLNGFTKNRRGFGYNFNLPNKQNLKLSYFLEREMFLWNARRWHVFTIEFRIGSNKFYRKLD